MDGDVSREERRGRKTKLETVQQRLREVEEEVLSSKNENRQLRALLIDRVPKRVKRLPPKKTVGRLGSRESVSSVEAAWVERWANKKDGQFKYCKLSVPLLLSCQSAVCVSYKGITGCDIIIEENSEFSIPCPIVAAAKTFGEQWVECMNKEKLKKGQPSMSPLEKKIEVFKRMAVKLHNLLWEGLPEPFFYCNGKKPFNCQSAVTPKDMVEQQNRITKEVFKICEDICQVKAWPALYGLFPQVTHVKMLRAMNTDLQKNQRTIGRRVTGNSAVRRMANWGGGARKSKEGKTVQNWGGHNRYRLSVPPFNLEEMKGEGIYVSPIMVELNNKLNSLTFDAHAGDSLPVVDSTDDDDEDHESGNDGDDSGDSDESERSGQSNKTHSSDKGTSGVQASLPKLESSDENEDRDQGSSGVQASLPKLESSDESSPDEDSDEVFDKLVEAAHTSDNFETWEEVQCEYCEEWSMDIEKHLSRCVERKHTFDLEKHSKLTRNKNLVEVAAQRHTISGNKRSRSKKCKVSLPKPPPLFLREVAEKKRLEDERHYKERKERADRKSTACLRSIYPAEVFGEHRAESLVSAHKNGLSEESGKLFSSPSNEEESGNGPECLPILEDEGDDADSGGDGDGNEKEEGTSASKQYIKEISKSRLQRHIDFLAKGLNLGGEEPDAEEETPKVTVRETERMTIRID